MPVAGVDFEIRRVVGIAGIRAPVEIAQVGGFGQQFFLAVKVETKVLRFQSVGVVDVPTDLVLILFINKSVTNLVSDRINMMVSNFPLSTYSWITEIPRARPEPSERDNF